MDKHRHSANERVIVTPKRRVKNETFYCLFPQSLTIHYGERCKNHLVYLLRNAYVEKLKSFTENAIG